MSLVFVKASRRAKAYTRARGKHRMFVKVNKKGSHRTRALKAYNKTSATLGAHNASPRQFGTAAMRRNKQLNKRLQYLRSYLN